MAHLLTVVVCGVAIEASGRSFSEHAITVRYKRGGVRRLILPAGQTPCLRPRYPCREPCRCEARIPYTVKRKLRSSGDRSSAAINELEGVGG